MKTPKSKKEITNETTVLYKGVEIDPIDVVAELLSKDKSLKAVVKHNRLTSTYEIDFYKNKKFVLSESYAFHTRGYHIDAAENYINGIKKI